MVRYGAMRSEDLRLALRFRVFAAPRRSLAFLRSVELLPGRITDQVPGEPVHATATELKKSPRRRHFARLSLLTDPEGDKMPRLPSEVIAAGVRSTNQA
jgi:hypothetical protein